MNATEFDDLHDATSRRNGCQHAALFSLKTVYGTFRICGGCSRAGHMHINGDLYRRGHLAASEAGPCQCEHASHNKE